MSSLANLLHCSEQPLTGFYRSGCCHTGPEDVGLHTVCIEVTADFSLFQKQGGNDLSTPLPDSSLSPSRSAVFESEPRKSHKLSVREFRDIGLYELRVRTP